jgi:hypothetical protein
MSTLATMPDTKADIEKYYTVYFNGEVAMHISPWLAISKKRTVEDLEAIKAVHVKRLELFAKIEEEEDPVILHLLADQITDIDFELQEAWGFDSDIRYHTWWYQAPKCSCAKLDNHDFLGSGLSSVNENCPLHGKLPV